MSDCNCAQTQGVKATDFDGIFHWRWDCPYLSEREQATCKALYTEEARAKGLLDAEGNFLPQPSDEPRAAPSAPSGVPSEKEK